MNLSLRKILKEHISEEKFIIDMSPKEFEKLTWLIEPQSDEIPIDSKENKVDIITEFSNGYILITKKGEDEVIWKNERGKIHRSKNRPALYSSDSLETFLGWFDNSVLVRALVLRDGKVYDYHYNKVGIPVPAKSAKQIQKKSAPAGWPKHVPQDAQDETYPDGRQSFEWIGPGGKYELWTGPFGEKFLMLLITDPKTFEQKFMSKKHDVIEDKLTPIKHKKPKELQPTESIEPRPGEIPPNAVTEPGGLFWNDAEGNKYSFFNKIFPLEWRVNNKLHREDGPAIGTEYGDKEWYINGKRHREDGPAVEWADGAKQWYINGKRHREDGPAVEWDDGAKEWYINDKRHREDGPAVEWANGYKKWFLNGKLHREDGPAIEGADGTREWYLNNFPLTEDQWKKEVKKLKESNFQKLSLLNILK